MLAGIIQFAVAAGALVGLFWVTDVWARGGSSKTS